MGGEDTAGASPAEAPLGRKRRAARLAGAVARPGADTTDGEDAPPPKRGRRRGRPPGRGGHPARSAAVTPTAPEPAAPSEERGAIRHTAQQLLLDAGLPAEK